MRQTKKNVSPMSNEGRNAYVIDRLTSTCLQLLEEKPLSYISVSQLCDQAGVGRASFYRNFTAREDILKNHIRRLFSGWIREYDTGSDKSLNRLVFLIFSHFESHREFYELLSQRNLIYLLKDMILELCGPKPEEEKMEAYTKAFVSYALYGWIEVWFQRGMKETAREMALLFQSRGL